MATTEKQSAISNSTTWLRIGTVFAARLLPLLLLVLPAVVQAQFNYTTNGGTITITKYMGSAFAVDIPSTIDGLPVSRIGGSAFGYNGLTIVIIPNSVTSFGRYAFDMCTNLTSITIPNSVTNIEEGVFDACSSMIDVTIPNSVTSIGNYAFQRCSGLLTITVDAQNSVYSSLDGVLFNKSKTTLIQCPGGKAGGYTIPNSVTSIEAGAFWYDTNLTSITIPNSVTNIGSSAFSFCTRLTSITIPNSVTSIGNSAFDDCPHLSAITVDAQNSVYSSWDGVLFNRNQTTLILYPGGKAGGYVIPDSVISIADGAFYECSSLTSITIPNGVTGIGDISFHSCISLTSVTIPNSVTNIGSFAFTFCNNLTSVNIGSSVKSIGTGAFYGCTRLTSINIPNSVISIGYEPFTYCTSLTSVTIGSSVTNIGDFAFEGCTKLTSVTIGSSVTSIDRLAFSGCTMLAAVYFKGNAPSVDSSAFNGASKAIVYYMPGTTGWGTTFGGRPSMLIHPSLEIKVKTVQVTMHVTPSRKYQLEASLDCKTWSKVGEPFVASSSEIVQDFDAVEVGRYFRLSEVQ